MMAAVEVVEAVGITVDRDDSRGGHLRRASALAALPPRTGPRVHRAGCGADIVRGSLRLWSTVGGSV